MNWEQIKHFYLEVSSAENKDQSDTYEVTVQTMDEQWIQLSSLQTAEVLFTEGMPLSVHVVTGDDQHYYFDTEIVRFDAENTQITIHKPFGRELSAVRRKQYLRVKAQLEVAVQKEEERFTALTAEVSAGGLTLLLENDQTLHVEDEVECWLLIHMKNGAIEHIPVEGVVLAVIESGKDLPRCKIEYTLISEADQQKLIRYCFERQFDFRSQ